MKPDMDDGYLLQPRMIHPDVFFEIANVKSLSKFTGKQHQYTVSHACAMHDQPCLSCKNYGKNNIHIQGQKLNSSTSKYEKFLVLKCSCLFN